jgi:hypothetical protein
MQERLITQNCQNAGGRTRERLEAKPGTTSMRLYLLFALSGLTFLTTAFGQVNPNKDRQLVLRHSIVGKTYVFDRSRNEDYNRAEIIYLGKVRTKDGRVFKILISTWYWGIVPRATNRILVYNAQNQYLGNYPVTMTNDLPGKIKNNALVFENKNRDDCDPNMILRVSFYNGLPKQFFLACKGNMGDIYSFGDE